MRFPILIIAASLAGCSTVTRPPVPESQTPVARPPEPGNVEPADPGTVESPSDDARLGSSNPGARPRGSGNTAATSLLNQGRADREAGNYAQAAASIERALGIDPNNAALWLELAEIRFAERQYDQADALARKTLTLAGGDRAITQRANRLIRR